MSTKIKFDAHSIKFRLWVYFAAIGGAGALYSKAIKSSELIAFPELLSEAIRKLEVVNFPAVVATDCYGKTIY